MQIRKLKTLIEDDAHWAGVSDGSLQLVGVVQVFEFDWELSTHQVFGLEHSGCPMDLRPASRNHTSGKGQQPRSDSSFPSADFVSVVRIARPSLATHRPILSCDKDNSRLLIFQDEGDSRGENSIPGSIAGGTTGYEFDAVHHWSTEQASLYRSVVQPVVEQTLQGYHGSVMAVGARGTGKRYIMRGGDEPNQLRLNRGAISRAAEQVFYCLNASRASARNLVVVVSYLSIANEVLHDLLSDGATTGGGGSSASSGTTARPTSRAGRSSRQAAVVLDEDGQIQGLSEHVVSSAGEVDGLLQRGIQRERKLQAEGIWRSSHAVFTITVEHRGGLGKDFAPISGVLRLVEVADWTLEASASAAGMQAHRDDTHQSREAPDESLVAFLQALDLAAAAGESQHKPGEAAAELPQASSGGSVLLRLLPGCVGGNSKTVLVWTVNESSQDSLVSRQVLTTASRCRSIRNTPNKRDLAEQALMNAYIRALRKKYRNLVFVEDKSAAADIPSGSSSKQSKKKWAVSGSQQARRISRPDDVIWNPTNAGRLSPTRSKASAWHGDTGHHADTGAERFPEDELDNTQSHGEPERSEASEDEYRFNDVGDTSPTMPAESMSAEDAADILAAAATGYGYVAMDQEPEEKECSDVQVDGGSEQDALVGSAGTHASTADLESKDEAELMVSGHTADPMNNAVSQSEGTDSNGTGTANTLNSASASNDNAAASEACVPTVDPSIVPPRPHSASQVRMRPLSTGSKSKKGIVTSRSRTSSAASRTALQCHESVSLKSNHSAIKQGPYSVTEGDHGSTGDTQLAMATGDTQLAMATGDTQLAMATGDTQLAMATGDTQLTMATGDTQLAMAEASAVKTMVPTSQVSSTLLEENGFSTESVSALLGVVTEAFGGLATEDVLVCGSELVDFVHQHMPLNHATVDRKHATWMVQWLLSSGFIVEQSSDSPNAMSGELCDDHDTMYSMATADEAIDPSYQAEEACTVPMHEPIMYSTPDPVASVHGGYEVHGTNHAAGGIQEMFADELVYDYKTGQPYLPSPAESSKYISLDPFEPNQLVLNEGLLHPFHSACGLAKNAGMLRNLVMMFGIEHCDSDQHTPLMYAVLGDKPSFISCLLECAAKPQKYDSFGYTALHHATRLGHIRSVNTILAKVNPAQIVPLISQVDAEGLTVLHWAVQLDSESFLQLYLRHSLPGLVNTMDYCQQTPLYWAIAQKKVQHVKLLLKSHADPMVVDGQQTPGSHLAIQCHAVSCLKVLLRHCPRLLDSKDGNGQTALHSACAEKSLECFNIILKATGKKWSGINATDNLHRTPLHCAALANSTALVQAVLQCKPGLLLKDTYGCTPLDCACSTSNMECELLLRNAEANLKRQSKGSAVCAVM